MKRFAIITLAFCAALGGWAQGYKLQLNKETGIYDKGERIVARLQGQTAVGDTLSLQVVVNNRVVAEQAIHYQGGDQVVYNQAVDSTCAVMLEIRKRQRLATSIGFVVSPEGFRPGYEEPKDLMDYWTSQKKQLQALPWQVKSTPLQVPDQYLGKYQCQDVEINCLGPAPVRAYMAKPVGAKKKSLPIIILCRAAGVSGNWCRCQVGECVGNAALGNGALSLDINAHGMLNGQTDDYYKMLEDGLLHNYFEHNAADRETYYFHGMYLRLLRAEIYCEMGLIDPTCPPSAVWASLNVAPGKKTINCVPFRTHAWPSGEDFPVWNKLYYQPRLDFINNYLK